MNKNFVVWDVIKGKWGEGTYFLDNCGDLCQRTICGVSTVLSESEARAYHYTGKTHKNRKIYEGDIYYIAGSGIGIVEICPMYGIVFDMKLTSETETELPLAEVLAENDLGDYLGHIEAPINKLEVT